ncbi:HAD-IIIA family hydrolase [Streptomonospora litoralis]|uniref:D,D-heptose 1,7-bisphosphate phosphatase n=1 Tax=Streptomonospora litoralis TaxID=2498135 RepID=A0A4P6Q2W8_9ACTN|nr:HAD-IIIA family hydrolase [Streptomonospora litoralis]QBI54510.1 D-glycero-beta-D-manno-heptose-1,7-bisphosphate 7-phosphatase [Streptomonospora litoralis]
MQRTPAAFGSAPAYSVVVPTVGRPALAETLRPLLDDGPHAPAEVVVVDDRAHPHGPPAGAGAPGITLVRSGGRGPACARDLGWRRTATPWVVFLDDDVLPGPDWTARLAEDLAACSAGIGGSQGRIEVPPPAGRRPTDAERGTLALAGAAWITADMAYRRSALEAVDGFDRRFKRAYREDTDIALRVLDAGYGLVTGTRRSVHPVVRDDRLLRSVAAQAGNADDALMRRHGPNWRERVGEPPGRLPRHVLTTAALAGAVAAVGASGAARGRRPHHGPPASGRVRVAGRRLADPPAAPARTARLGGGLAAGLGLLWFAATAEFAWRRIAPGPRSADEVVRMAVTSVLIPPAACAQRLLGEWRHRGALPHADRPVKAVLFDRDGTLVYDVAYNADPDRVRPLPGARRALRRVRSAGLRLGVVSNQSGVARGFIAAEQLDAVNAEVEGRLGPFDVWAVCTHGADDGCACRKPRPGLVDAAAAELGVAPEECAVIGDIGADVDAARAAGARAVLVPGPATRPAETAAAPETAARLTSAVRRLLRGSAR